MNNEQNTKDMAGLLETSIKAHDMTDIIIEGKPLNEADNVTKFFKAKHVADKAIVAFDKSIKNGGYVVNKNQLTEIDGIFEKIYDLLDKLEEKVIG